MSKYPILLFWPEPLKPKPFSRVYRICQEYDVPFHSDPDKPYDLHFFWSYCKKQIDPDFFTLSAPNVINRGCWDIGKEKVTAIFDDITIDPETYHGTCVQKIDQQGDHNNHSIIQCPAPRKDGYIYQRYIEQREGPHYFRNRIYYAGGIEYILRQTTLTVFGMMDRFKNVVKSEFVNVRTIFTERQQWEFDQKCKEFGFDYGDADLLIENGKPIIIDINNIVGPHFFAPWNKEAQDTQFLKFIQKRYENSSNNIRL